MALLTEFVPPVGVSAVGVYTVGVSAVGVYTVGVSAVGTYVHCGCVSCGCVHCTLASSCEAGVAVVWIGLQFKEEFQRANMCWMCVGYVHAKLLLSVLALVRGVSSHTFLMYCNGCLGK